MGDELNGVGLAYNVDHELVQRLGTDNDGGDVVGLHAEVHEELEEQVP